MKKRAALLPGVALLLAALASRVSVGAGPPAADELLRRVEGTWNQVHARLTARMTVARPGRPDSTFDLLIDRDGGDRARIEFVAPPKERGKVVLIVGGKMWLYLPRADKVTAVSRRRNPLAGGLLFDDLTAEKIADVDARVEDLDEGYLLELRPRPKSAQGVSRILFDKSSLLPLRRDVLSPSGKLLRRVVIEETRIWRGASLPTRLRMIDAASGGGEVGLVVTKISEPLPGAKERFDPARLKPSATPGRESAPVPQEAP